MSARKPLSDTDSPGPLAGLRVLEIGSGTNAPYAAKLLGDFGACVIKVESAEGDGSRARGPFPSDRFDPEASGLYSYLNTNKFGMVADLDSRADQEAIHRLLIDCDVLITNLPEAVLTRTGLAPSALRKRFPSLVITTLSPFGPDPVWGNRQGDELVTFAMGGLAYSTPGMPDAADDREAEPPLHPNCFAAETLTGLVGANATLAALNHRAHAGQGSHIELSQHATVASLQHRDVTTHSYLGGEYERLLNPLTIGRMPNFYLPCRDGWVTIAAPMVEHWNRLVAGMGHPEWATSARFSTPKARTENWVELRNRLIDWTMTLTGDQLFDFANEQQLPIFPFYSVKTVSGTDHVRARGSLVTVPLGDTTARMPAAPVGMRRTPWSIRRPAPRLGEHDDALRTGGWPQVRRDRRWSIDPSAQKVASPPLRNAADGSAYRPLAGVRILDLGQFIAIPFCTLWLAWMGAEVIVVESGRRMTSRSAPPFLPGLEGNPNASGYFNLLNAGKKSVRVDMTTAEGRTLVRSLACKVDVLVDNFSTGVVEKLGLDYETLRHDNPGLIAVSCGAFGRSGPMRMARGLHSAVNLYSGVADVTGYPGGGPRILGGVLPDPLAGTYAGFAVMAALTERRSSGVGQYVDLAMYEAMMTLIPEAVIDLSVNQREPVRAGSRDSQHAPHGIFRCKSEGDWVAISVRDDAGWQKLCAAVGHPEWLGDARFAGAAARLAHVAELEQKLTAWTLGHSAAEVAEILQSAGVAAGPVIRVDQLLFDPLLSRRGTIIDTEHPLVGKRTQLGLPWRTDTGAFQYERAPLLGEHTREVLADFLGIDDAEFGRLERCGALA
jgi:crotonobetainyl-CoA:carnitine CoA-transferase CaiB-like acyl-CoA transferase